MRRCKLKMADLIKENNKIFSTYFALLANKAELTKMADIGVVLQRNENVVEV